MKLSLQECCPNCRDRNASQTCNIWGILNLLKLVVNFIADLFFNVPWFISVFAERDILSTVRD